jgi:hypothetical protein
MCGEWVMFHKEMFFMPSIKLAYKDMYSSASFEGVLEPVGISGYEFSGMLSASTPLVRSSSPFQNTVRLGHGGTLGEYTELEFTFGSDLVKLPVKGSGTREPNDTVDFRLGFNEGLNGEFHNKAKTTSVAGGPPQKVSAMYSFTANNGLTNYHVRFDGAARADTPTRFLINGKLDVLMAGNTVTTQYATIGYKSSSGSWVYQTFDFSSPRQDITIYGDRRSGDSLQLVVGATSKVANLYGYGDVVTCELPELF